MHAYRTHTCAELRAGDVGETVRLSGWVHRKRDHGHLLFVDLRDHYGITQIVTDTDSPAFKTLDRLRVESVVTVEGEVVARSGGDGEPEPADRRDRGPRRTRSPSSRPRPSCRCRCSASRTIPRRSGSSIATSICAASRSTRNIMLRSAVIASIRRRMIEQGFTEFQTPILTASSPEGARDYLVPSRVHPGKFYALPQAPQMFKQLIMVAGFDRYFQIAPCFRDEDARADRSPGRILPARFRDELRHAGRRVRRDRAGAVGRVRGIRERADGHSGGRISAHSRIRKRC